MSHLIVNLKFVYFQSKNLIYYNYAEWELMYVFVVYSF